jgi:hypothetical protein
MSISSSKDQPTVGIQATAHVIVFVSWMIYLFATHDPTDSMFLMRYFAGAIAALVVGWLMLYVRLHELFKALGIVVVFLFITDLGMTLWYWGRYHSTDLQAWSEFWRVWGDGQAQLNAQAVLLLVAWASTWAVPLWRGRNKMGDAAVVQNGSSG